MKSKYLPSSGCYFAQLINDASKLFVPWCLALLFIVGASGADAQAADPAEEAKLPLPEGVSAVGELTAVDDHLEVTDRRAVQLIAGDENSSDYVLKLDVMYPEKSSVDIIVGSKDLTVPIRHPGDARAVISQSATQLIVSPSAFDKETEKWLPDRQTRNTLVFWPTLAKSVARLTEDGFTDPKTVSGQWLAHKIEVRDKIFRIWIAGQLVHQFEAEEPFKGPLWTQFGKGVAIKNLTFGPASESSLFRPAAIGHLTEAGGEAISDTDERTVDQVPFDLVAGGSQRLNLQHAHWVDAKRDPSSYYEIYDGGPYFFGDKRMPMVTVPAADYTAVHFLAVAEDDESLLPGLTLRMGKYGYSNHTVRFDYAASIPRRDGRGSERAVSKLDTSEGPLYHVRVPIAAAHAQDLSGVMDIELTRGVYVTRRRPDPARFRTRPAGPASGVRIAAMTLELSPLQMKTEALATGHLFVEPEKPRYKFTMQNITEENQPFQIQMKIKDLYGSELTTELQGEVPAGATKEFTHELPYAKPGYHDLDIALHGADDKILLKRHVNFGVLPTIERKHRDTSPFGTWDFSGGHYTSNDPDFVGSLYQKIGFRYGMFGFPEEKRQQWGVFAGNSPQVQDKGAENYKKYMERSGVKYPAALLLHEHAISGPHVMRPPDIFHDLPPYKLSDDEQKRFDLLWDQCIRGAKSMREEYPEVHLRLGNGTATTKEEFLRRGFPKELFDSLGNESGVFGRPPEAQPPDNVAMNAGIWMDRQIANAYGYEDKPITQCYEICYPNTNPGNLTLDTQAKYFVRHAMHALSWGIPEIKMGAITDMGNSYYFSNWGASGIFTQMPDVQVKPAAIALSTMTRLLDGAKYVDKLDLGSFALYGVTFDLPDGKKASVLWTIRGERPVTLTLPGKVEVFDIQGNPAEFKQDKDAVTVTLSSSPIYVMSEQAIKESKPGEPVYTAAPQGQVTELAELANLDDWEMEQGRDIELDSHDFLCLRRLGNFEFTPNVKFEGDDPAIQVTPGPVSTGKATMPMYQVLKHKQGIKIPGEPNEIGLYVNGNGGWGRIIFELTDASGQRWISIGASQTGEVSPWMMDWMPKEAIEKSDKLTMADWNTDDVFGESKINFDGWRYLSFPLPGNYEGEQQFPWPSSSQWKHTGDGVVHYPLTFTRLVVELPEKTLHMKDFTPVTRSSIYIRDLTACEYQPKLHQRLDEGQK